MRTIKMKVFALILTGVLFSQGMYSQEPYYMSDQDDMFYQAKDLFEKEKYEAARKMFDDFAASDGTGLLVEEAGFLEALCAVNLYNDDADYLLYRFIKTYPESQFHNQAVFEMGRLAYRGKQYGNVIRWMDEVDPLDLTAEERTEYYFIKGYSHFRRTEYEAARVAFYEILDARDRYQAPALYYYSHIHYEQENFETALKGFLELGSDEVFAAIVPYYITHIYYQQGKWDEVIAFALPKLDSVTESRYAEMAKIIGEAYFHKDLFKEAVPYLEQFHDRVNFNTKEDKYQMAYAYYMVGNYEKAVEYFKSVSIGKTELNQSANYHMADCYVKLGDKKQARHCFYQAASMDFNEEIKEDALFNYAVVTYELSITPFNEAVQGFSRYISLYPASERTDEAYKYMVLAFMNTRNYRAALAVLEKIQRRSEDIEKSYQRVAFFRGLELFNDLSFMDAIDKFDASLKYGQYDGALRALCYYWKGESWYRLKVYDQAIEFYGNFLQTDGVTEMEEYATAHYNMGYAEFNKENYKEAMNWFKRFENLDKGENNRIQGDACNRIGDLYFQDARYAQAIEYYDKAIASGVTGVDYALFQRGISEGVLDKHKEKIAILGIILDKYKSSTYTPDALFETGRSYFIMGQADKAIPYYTRLLESYSKSSYVSRALLQLGLIYYNKQDEEKSLAYYKRVVAEFPGTPESNNALLGIKNVYVENNQVNEYFAFVESLGTDINITRDEQDSLVYLAAENIYMSGDCEQAVSGFGSYIESFPSGAYLLNAHYYKAECQLKSRDLSNALISLNYVIRQPRNAFTVPAVLAASRINYSSGNYAEALENYLMLYALAETKVNTVEAGVGKMRCYYLLEEYANTIDAARELLRDEFIAGELKREAHYKIAKSFLAQDRFALALEEFKIVSGDARTVEGAESKYRVAELLYVRKEYEEAKDVIFDFVEQNTPHQYWMAKSFIILADIYMIEEDSFQALATLESVIDYYEVTDDGILDLARRRKAGIMDKEQNRQDTELEQAIEIEMEEQ